MQTLCSFTLNEKRFVQGKNALKDVPESFGFFRKTRGGLLLFLRNGRRIGGVRRDGLIYRSSRLEINGKPRWWHQPAPPEELGGLEYMSLESHEEARKALEIGFEAQPS
ncbi:hypothetical protein TK90_2649 (plasmid) [Thioalkalivibrio sp. K90mix]|uniref:hypothetical protein n=1 Tax=Thioalkalivibrio sp. (strain K90mix) TaxID=396595 RepID=UPI000195ABA5|nr:hypothetical protein [Thioalkalivibrio sp. K90mix]ADC73136.1 hypothetical protein TK90_2649 [Thioalkalivibrio sp. K90mix]